MWLGSHSTCHPKNGPWHPLGAPNASWCPYTPSGPWVESVSPQYTPDPPWHSQNGPQHPLMPPIPLLVFNCHHFATDHLHVVQMLIFYCCHFQLSSLCNWPSPGVCLLYNIPSLGVKGTSALLWSSANFCSISQNMHYKAPVASQHWKTNQVVWTWKDDWTPWRTSTYKRPFTREGSYLVSIFSLFFNFI